MLDDGDRGVVELGDQLEGGVGVVQVVEAELLALDLRGAGDPGPGRAADIERRLLVRVLAIAQDLRAATAEREALGQLVADLAREPAGDRGVIGAGMRVGLGGEAAAQIGGGAAVIAFHLLTHRIVVLRPGGDGNETVVLGGGADQRRPADVDVLDAGREPGAARDRLLEGIEVHHQQVDRRDVVHRHRELVLLVVAAGKQPAVDHRMQRLDPAVHDLREAGVIRDLGHGDIRLPQQFRRAPGRQDGDVALREEFGEFDQPRLVRDGDQGAGDLADGHGGFRWRPTMEAASFS